MANIIAIAIGGIMGSVLRFIISRFIQKLIGIDFPSGTLMVNLTASFLIGIFFSYFVEKLTISPIMRAFLITGFLGSFSTFSTFSYESYYLIMNGEMIKFIFYTIGSVGGGIFMTLLGYNIGRIKGKPLYKYITEFCRSKNIAGVTVFRGILGYGKSSIIHKANLFKLSSNLPILVEIVDKEEKIMDILPEIAKLISSGLITLEKVKIIRY